MNTPSTTIRIGMALAAAALLWFPQTGTAQAGFLLDDESSGQVRTPRQRPAPAARPRLTPPRPRQVRVESQTEATVIHRGRCLNGACGRGARVASIPDRIDPTKVAGNSRETASAGTRAQCYSRALLAAAKEVVRRNYGNRSSSRGQCAKAVRQSLDRAGFNNGVGLLNAIDYHMPTRFNGRRPTLPPLGFKRLAGATAATAPPGAILVYSGPASSNYARNAWHDGTGHYLGHVTIKGDDGYYYTDGRTRAPAVANRTLVGVYVMEDCVKCSAAVRRRCGG